MNFMQSKTTWPTDEQSLVSVKSESGHIDYPIYDDGYGPLWVHRNSIGISGIVRAQTWRDAYEICEDEFFPEADETMEEIQKEYNFKRNQIKWVKTLDGKLTRPATLEDYPLDAHGLEFDHWETLETPCDDCWSENELFQESFGFRPNGPNKKDKLNHGIYAKDLNGDSLEELTEQEAKRLGLIVTLKEEN